jgi:hypothetical protein
MVPSRTRSSERTAERTAERLAERLTERLTERLNVLSWDCGMSNLAYCLLEDQDDPEREHAVRLWENFSLRADSMAEAVTSLRRELDARPWMLLADHVVVEAQVAANPQMKIIAHALQMYFVARRAATGATANVHFVCPKSKFKVCNVPDPDGARGHAKNKKIAILMAQKMLAREKPSLEYLNSHRKKDDLADSYLQAVYFMRTLKARKRNLSAILAHLAPTAAAAAAAGAAATGASITIDESDDERPHQRLYRCEDFALRAEFCIDAASVERGTRFARQNPPRVSMGG